MVFSNQLIKWYALNFRQLPWRETNDPYKIWLSEIILQQTRVSQGLPYYLKFSGKYPTVKHLAKANINDVLKLWQGLGYYSRAHNMHETATEVAEKYKGKFPASFDQLIKLKGIGEYTAAAISSISSNEKRAVVDGNVYRVLSRVFGMDVPVDTTQGKKVFIEKANSLLPAKNPGTYNQAIMEFGALQCTPSNPGCQNCIFNKTCVAFLMGKVSDLPVKEKRTKVRNRYLNYFFIHDQKKMILRRRDHAGIWKGLFEFPVIETEQKLINARSKAISEFLEKFSVSSRKMEKHSFVHQLSHQKLFVDIYSIKSEKIKIPSGYKLVDLKQSKLPGVPQIILKFLKDIPEFRKDL